MFPFLFRIPIIYNLSVTTRLRHWITITFFQSFLFPLIMVKKITVYLEMADAKSQPIGCEDRNLREDDSTSSPIGWSRGPRRRPRSSQLMRTCTSGFPKIYHINFINMIYFFIFFPFYWHFFPLIWYLFLLKIVLFFILENYAGKSYQISKKFKINFNSIYLRLLLRQEVRPVNYLGQ